MKFGIARLRVLARITASRREIEPHLVQLPMSTFAASDSAAWF
jgi:hypothetical protein